MRTLLPLGALLLLSVPGCKTTAPRSDATPPTLEWVVTNRTPGPSLNAQVRFNGSGTVNARRGEEYLVTLNARDPQGIHRIELGGAGEYACRSGSVVRASTIHEDTDEQELNPGPDGQVLTQIFLLRNVGFADWTCQSGYTYQSGQLRLRGRGENYFNGLAGGTLYINVAP